MKLTWYGHSCFMLESRAGKVVFDPYADDFPPGLRLPQLAADLVLCSHGHGDHNAEDKVTLSGEQTDYTVESLCCWHDDEGGKKRGENLIRIVSGGGAKVCHLGDVGHMLSKGQIKAIGHVDALLIPVGGYYTIDAGTARELADAIDAQLVIPMHCRGEGYGLAEIDTVEPFLALSKNVEFADGPSIELPDFGAPRTVVLKLR